MDCTNLHFLVATELNQILYLAYRIYSSGRDSTYLSNLEDYKSTQTYAPTLHHNYQFLIRTPDFNVRSNHVTFPIGVLGAKEGQYLIDYSNEVTHLNIKFGVKDESAVGVPQKKVTTLLYLFLPEGVPVIPKIYCLISEMPPINNIAKNIHIHIM